ncbi:MAG: hypothetical protein ACM3Q9_01185 [Methanosarcina sp.]
MLIRVFAALAALLCLAFASTAKADFGIKQVSVNETDTAGSPLTQAGAHPDLNVELHFNTILPPGEESEVADGQLRNEMVTLPNGFYGNPGAAATCPIATFGEGIGCPPGSRIGTLTLLFSWLGSEIGIPFPAYNLETEPNETADFGVNAFGATVNIVSTVGPDGRVHTSVLNANQGLGFVGLQLHLWGVPGAAVHDSEREGPSGIQPKPLLTAPADCNATRNTTIRVASWQNPSDWLEETVSDGQPTGCDLLEFEPSLKVKPDEQRTSSPSGVNFDVKSPQNLDPEGLGTPPIRNVTVKLPQGMNLSPAAASGLTTCSDSELGLGTEAQPTCPNASKIGSVSVDTPVLSEPLSGSVYLRPPTQDAIARPVLVLNGPGILLKVPGTVVPDANTGQLTATFSELPQLPFSELHLRFKGGPRAPLTTPPSCGPQTTQVSFTAWSGQTVNGSTTFNNGNGGAECSGAKFSPAMSAGSVNPVAGATTPFVLRLQRRDSEPDLTGVTLHLPPGLSAYLKGVPYCSDGALAGISSAWGAGAAEVANPSCPAASQIGSATIGAGAGSNPFYLETAKVYLAGPYKGAPLSLAVVAPAIAGPFDLGNVVVRSALQIDPQTAEATAVSDPLPTILQGIPLVLQDIRLNLDRPAFMVNPTNCSEMEVSGSIGAANGEVAAVGSRYQVGSCGALGFGPHLALSFTGKTHRGSHPKLRTVLKTPKGDANISRAVVTLPHAAFLDQAHIRTVCTRVQFAADACPDGSIYGHAKARSPLLGYVLSGPVYLRSSSHELPDLVARLRGPSKQPIEIDLDGRIDSVHGALRTTFAQVPDAPVSQFVLEMFGGKRGLIELSTDDYCAGEHRVKAAFKGQNGSRSSSRPVLGNARCTK